MLDHNKVMLDCSGGPMQLLRAEEEDFCYTLAQTAVIPVVAVMATVAAIICLTIAIYSLNRQRLLVYLYSKKWSRRFFHEEYIDQDKHFDAFISYSHADTDYVENTLLKGLECSSDPEFRYKVTAKVTGPYIKRLKANKAFSLYEMIDLKTPGVCPLP